MKISIITAAYNSSNTIRKALVSVLDQTYKDIECLIIDGNSIDNTFDIVQDLKSKYPNKSIIWHSENDQGIYDALNKGIAKATGDVIGFVHSDDYLASNDIIESIVEEFKAKAVIGVYGDLHYVSYESTSKIIRNWKSSHFSIAKLEKGWMPPHPTLYLKAEVYRTKGNFDLNYKIAADYDFILRVFSDRLYSFSYLPRTIVKMRLGGASNKSLSNILLKMKEDYKTLKKNKVGGFGSLFLKNFSKLKQFKK